MGCSAFIERKVVSNDRLLLETIADPTRTNTVLKKVASPLRPLSHAMTSGYDSDGSYEPLRSRPKSNS